MRLDEHRGQEQGQQGQQGRVGPHGKQVISIMGISHHFHVWEITPPKEARRGQREGLL